MALRMSSKKSTPLSFDLQQDLFGKLKKIQRQTGARSISEVVRYAVSQIDASELKLSNASHRQISVRLSDKLRQRLVKLSKQQKVSLGELLRAALDSLPEQPTGNWTDQIHPWTLVAQHPNTVRMNMDQCMTGAANSKGQPVRKRTEFTASTEILLQPLRKYKCNHTHHGDCYGDD